MTHVNQVLLSGIILNTPKAYPDKLVFTLWNERGRFYIQYTGPETPTLSLALEKGQMVMIHGQLYSVPVEGRDMGRIKAEKIILMNGV